jgi:hypothetical protein
MDHLSYPEWSPFSSIEVSYLCEDLASCRSDMGDFIPFGTFLVSTTYSGIHWYYCTPDLAIGRAQAFLFFGLLKEILGDHFFLDDFIRTINLNSSRENQRSRRDVVSLANLESKLSNMQTNEGYLLPDGPKYTASINMLRAAVFQASHVQ